jgi:type IV secretion system protein VirB1
MLATLPDCPHLAVPREILAAVVRVESAYNPFAIGVVGNRLIRQPKNKEEAVATAQALERAGYNYSVGMAQVNRTNFSKYGINSTDNAFDICANLVAGSKILQECFSRSGTDWSKAFSCYYSGNFVTGYKHGYVQKVNSVLIANNHSSNVKTNQNLQLDVAPNVIKLANDKSNAAPAATVKRGGKSHTNDTNEQLDSARVF